MALLLRDAFWVILPSSGGPPISFAGIAAHAGAQHGLVSSVFAPSVGRAGALPDASCCSCPMLITLPAAAAFCSYAHLAYFPSMDNGALIPGVRRDAIFPWHPSEAEYAGG